MKIKVVCVEESESFYANEGHARKIPKILSELKEQDFALQRCG